MAISTNGTVIARLAGGLYNTVMSNATYLEVAAQDPSALANTLYSRDFAKSTDLAVATTLITNLGLSAVAGLDNWVAAQLTAAGTAGKGAKIVSMLNDFAGMTADTTYGAAATAFNTKVDAALAASQRVGAVEGKFETAGVVAVANATFTLTTGIDGAALFTGGAGNDSFVATHLTLNATDVLAGGSGTDTLTVTDTGAAAFSTPSALITGIENVTIRNLNGTAAIAEVAEQQIVYASGAAAATADTTFLGVVTAQTAAATAAAVATAIVANKAAILAGTAAIAAGITDLTDNSGSIILTYGGALGKGDVANIAAAGASNGTSFSAGIEYRKGVSAVAANTYTDTVAAATFVDATSFTSDNSTSPVSFTGLAAGQTVTVLGNTATTNGATTAAWGATVAAPVLKLVGGTGGGALTVTAAGGTSVTLESSGAPLGTTGLPGSNSVGSVDLGGKADSTLNIIANSNLSLSSTSTFTTASKAIVVTGAATSVSFGAGSSGTTALTAANLETINASGMTAGGVTVALTAGTKSFVGGQGADTVATAAFTNTGVTVDGGAGSDTLIIGTAAHLDTPAEAALYTNFETIRTAGSFDASLLASATGFQMAAAGTLTNLNATQAASVRLRADGASYGVSLYDATGTADSTKITLGSGSTGAAAVDITTGLTANGFETINLVASPSSTATAGGNSTSTVAAFTADKATAINLTGTSFSLSNIATTKAVTIDGSALTGDRATTPVGLTVAGSAAVGSTIIGSAVGDSFTLGAVGSTYNAGAGKDAISSSVANLVGSGVYNTIDGGTEVDTLTISDAAALTLTDTQFAKITNVEKITITSTTTGDQSITTGGWFNANFLTGATITTTTSTGDVTLDASTFTGPLTVVATEAGTGAGEGKLTITTGSGNDSVTVTTAAAGDNDVINLGAGNDTFVGSLDAETVTGGRGQDTMTGGGTTANTYVFTAGSTGATDALFDTITDFSAVAGNVINAGAAEIVTYATSSTGVAAIAASGLATFASADATVAQRIVAVEAAINAGGTAAAGQAAMWQQGSDVYVLISDGVDGVTSDDILIKLVGVDTTNAAFNVLTDGGTTFTIA